MPAYTTTTLANPINIRKFVRFGKRSVGNSKKFVRIFLQVCKKFVTICFESIKCSYKLAKVFLEVYKKFI
jgi:hypothetical protein